MLPTIAATAATPMMPSMSSRRGVGMRTKVTSPIINGATVMMPIASDNEPVPPGDQGWHIRTMEQLIRHGSAHSRNGGPDDCRPQESRHMTHPGEGKISTDVTLI